MHAWLCSDLAAMGVHCGLKKLVQASSGYEFDPDTCYSADDLQVFLNLAFEKRKEPWNTG